jgi:hypothetical protein
MAYTPAGIFDRRRSTRCGSCSPKRNKNWTRCCRPCWIGRLRESCENNGGKKTRGSYKEIYEIEFITRTRKIINDYNKRKNGYKLTLLLNCLVGLIILPDQRTEYGKPPLWEIEIDQIPIFQNAKISPKWSNNNKHTLEQFIRKLRNGIAHQNIEPINRNNHFVGVKIWNVNQQNIIDCEVKFDRHTLHEFASFIADQYLHHISAQKQKRIIGGTDG